MAPSPTRHGPRRARPTAPPVARQDAARPATPPRARHARRPRRALAALLAAASLAGCGPDAPDTPNLVLITIDTLRADHLGAYGYERWDEPTSPAIDALAARGVTFETVYAPRGQTHPSLASLITGTFPITHGVRENGQRLSAEHTTLLQQLQDAGYQTGAFIANFEVHSEYESWIARGADQASDGFQGRRQLEAPNESRFQRVWDDRVEAAALAFLDGVDRDKPFALWVHFYDVHKPYNPPPAEISRFGPRQDVPPVLVTPGDDSGHDLELHLAQLTFGQREPTPTELARIDGLYDGAVRATDQRVAALLAHLDDLGETDSSVVVLSSDHGEELYDHNRYFFHGSSIHDGTVRIPLIVAGPSLPAGRRVPQLARTIDIAPTVLDLLGQPSAPGMEGGSLRPLADGSGDTPPSTFAVIEWQDLIYAVSDGSHKLIRNPEHVWTRKPPYHAIPGSGYRIECLEGYDLVADPREQHNLLADIDYSSVDMTTGAGLPDVFQPHFKALRRFLSDPRHQVKLIPGDVGAAERKRLEQLGYMNPISADRNDSMKLPPCGGEH